MGKLAETSAAVRVEQITGAIPVEQAIARVAARRDGFVLESAGRSRAYGRYTILGFEPAEVVTITEARDPLAVLAQRAGRMPAALGDASPGRQTVPFVGGWVGFISYEAGLTIEGIAPSAPDEWHMPLMRFGLYDALAIFDHVEQKCYAVAVDWTAMAADTPLDRADVRTRLERVMATLTRTESRTGDFEKGLAHQRRPICSRPAAMMTRSEHAARVARIKEHILAGDVYQVNLTMRFDATTSATPLEVYHRLRIANPADFSAFIAWDDQAILSSSPELFLDLRDGRVITRPIKGTRPRTGDAALDERRQRELTSSEKDRAELNMIIDLLRNDLGRVCRYGSVRVESDGELEAHPTVFHRVATICGELAEGQAWSDLLRATLPGGSVTGAPKIAACRIINELEPTRRDVYCGAIGYLGLDGNMRMNVAIRTMQMSRGRLCLHAGGGIVADSDPDEEYEEVQAKAAGMMRALGYEP